MHALIEWFWNASVDDFIFGIVIAALILSWIVSLFRKESS